MTDDMSNMQLYLLVKGIEKTIIESTRMAISALEISLLLHGPTSPRTTGSAHRLRDVVNVNKHGERPPGILEDRVGE